MGKLLSAGFARLLKNKLFWLLTVGFFLYGIFTQTITYWNILDSNTGGINLTTGKVVTMADQLFISIYPLIFLLAAFISLFLGTEYSDGAMRNKLIVGHSRAAVYLSSLITCIAAGCMLLLAYLASATVVGVLLLPAPEEWLPILLNLLTCLLLIAAVTALCTLLSMLCQNKAAVAVLVMLGILALFLTASMLSNALMTPESSPTVLFIDGELVTQTMKNTGYVTGVTRDVFQFIVNLLPTGQAIYVARGVVPFLWQLPVYSLLLIALTTLGGILAFRRKDIK